MKQKNRLPRIGLLCLLGAVLLTGCGGKTDPPVGTTETRPRAYTEGPNDATQTTTDGRTDGEMTGGKQEEVMPKVDIETVQANKKLFVGNTDKDAISYQIGEDIKFTVRLNADGKIASCAKFKYVLKADDGRTPEEAYVDGKTGVFKLTTKLNVPGFVSLQVTACNKDGNPIEGVEQFNGGAGVAVSDIQKKGGACRF